MLGSLWFAFLSGLLTNKQESSRIAGMGGGERSTEKEDCDDLLYILAIFARVGILARSNLVCVSYFQAHCSLGWRQEKTFREYFSILGLPSSTKPKNPYEYARVV
jgi:hypothetical protein